MTSANARANVKVNIRVINRKRMNIRTSKLSRAEWLNHSIGIDADVKSDSDQSTTQGKIVLTVFYPRVGNGFSLMKTKTVDLPVQFASISMRRQ